MMMEMYSTVEQSQYQQRLKIGTYICALILSEFTSTPTADELIKRIEAHCAGDETLERTTMCVMATVLTGR